MKNKNNSVAPKGAWVKNGMIKIVTFFTCIVLIFINIGIYFSTYGIGYKYYKNENNEKIQIGTTQQKDLLNQTINDYLDELKEDEYYVCSTKMKKDITYEPKIIAKDKTNTEEIKDFIIKNISVSILSTKLSIKNDNNTYFFKTENSCLDFINSLKQYNNIDYSIESIIVEKEKITDKNILENKIEEYRLDYEAREAARKAAEQKKKEAEQKKIVIASRGTNIQRKQNISITGSRHPLDSYTCISSGFGQRWGSFHSGVDFATPLGTPVHAWKSGKVIYASWCGSYGNYIKIRHEDGTESCYAHLSRYACSVGDYVNCHDIIAYSGSTGNSTGPHLHFEIKVNNQFVNPLNYI